MKLKTLISAAVLTAMAGGAFAGGHAIRLGTEGAYPPYNLINDAGQLDGMEIEMGNELCARAELDCTWVQNEWDSIIPNLVGGNYDTIIAGMSITDERDEVIDFSEPYIPPEKSAYVGLAGASEDVRMGVVATQINTIQSGFVAESGATLLEFATPDETMAAVRNGEADAVFAQGQYLQAFVDGSNGELEFIGELVALGGGVGIGLRESDAELKAALNEAIASMKADGTLNAMITKWFGEDALLWE